MDLKDKIVGIVGAGRTGRACAAFARAQGARRCILNERKTELELGQELRAFTELGVELRLGQHTADSLSDCDLVLVSPGVPLTLPSLLYCRERGIPVLGELELASRFIQAPIIAVTGTNGKSTTVSLIHAMLQASGIDSVLAGNIGTPLLDVLLQGKNYDAWVVEVSSYQLETTIRFHPHIAVLLNITADHFGRHGDMTGYIAAKAKIFAQQNSCDYAVVSADDPAVTTAAAPIASQRVTWSLHSNPAQISLSTEGIRWQRAAEQESYSLKHFQLAGLHQKENAMAAVAAARLAGADQAAIQATLNTFTGLPHRFVTVATQAGVTFINDSKATNVGAAVRAVEGIAPGTLILLAGGEDKGASYEPLREVLLARQAKHVCVYGEAAERLEAELTGIPCVRVVTLAEALNAATRVAQTGDTVLLAPACASFDQFRNFEHRGDVFAQLVHEREAS